MLSKNENITHEFEGNGLQTKEKNWGKKRFKEYLEHYPHLHKKSDLVILEELVFNEAMHERMKLKISKISKKKKDGKEEIVPTRLHKSFADSLDMQIKLKERLGLFETEQKLDVFKDFQEMREDFAEYRRKNPDLFRAECPKCSFVYFMKRRTKDYEVCGTEWFRDKVLFNKELWKCFESKNPLSKQDMANILGVSEDQIDWLNKFNDKKPKEK